MPTPDTRLRSSSPRDQAPILLKSRQTVLGVIPDVPYQDLSLDLSPGSLLLLYTDGVSEAPGSGGELFGVHRIEHTVLGLERWDPDTILRTLEERLASFSGPDPFDDQTLVCLQRLPVPEPTLNHGGRYATA